MGMDVKEWLLVSNKMWGDISTVTFPHSRAKRLHKQKDVLCPQETPTDPAQVGEIHSAKPQDSHLQQASKGKDRAAGRTEYLFVWSKWIVEVKLTDKLFNCVKICHNSRNSIDIFTFLTDS